jgi:hypothetical protein
MMITAARVAPKMDIAGGAGIAARAAMRKRKRKRRGRASLNV